MAAAFPASWGPNSFGQDITLAAVLLLGNRPTLARYAPQHELTFTRRQSAPGMTFTGNCEALCSKCSTRSSGCWTPT